MFNKKIKLIIPILSIFLFLGFLSPIKAAKFESGDYTLNQSQIIEENLYIQGDTIDISGVIDGDLLAAGDSIDISGTVTGDIYLAGSTINITGNIYGSTYMAGQNIDMSGSVARSVFLASMFSDVSGSIGKDLTAFATNSTVSGKVTEDIRVFSNQSIITGTVNGEALIYSPNSNVDEEKVQGEIYENIEIEETEVTQKVSNMGILKTFRGGFLGINIFSTILGFVSMYIVGVVLIYLAPVKTLEIEKKVVGSAQEFLYSFLVGLGISVVLPLPLIILTVTIVGAPLALLIGGVYFFITLFGTLWVESALGYKILSSSKKKDDLRLLSLLVGRGLTSVVNLIPIVRGFYKTAISMVAVGAVVRMKYDVYQERKNGNKSSKKKKSKK
jgi:hypothetical protein